MVACGASVWRCPQRPSLGDRRDVWRNKMVNSLYLLTYPVRVRIDELGPERDRPVNFSGSVNQRLREFWREIPGCGRYLEGPFRTPEILSRNRDRDAGFGIVANPCQNWPRTRNARQPISRRRALTGLAFLSVEKKRAPPAGEERNEKVSEFEQVGGSFHHNSTTEQLFELLEKLKDELLRRINNS